jgi:nitroreductase
MKRNDSVPEWEEMCAVGCAVQNMALQASALGIHGYWTSWQVPARESAEMQQLLGLDPFRGDKCLGFFVVGTADAERVVAYRPKRQPLADKVVWKL